MSRWIEVEPLISDLDKGLGGKDWDKVLTEAIINDAPSIDICFCRECKRRYRSGYRGDEYWVCDFMDAKIKDDDFCSYGERSSE